MTSQNFLGDLSELGKMRTPLTVLNEQAGILSGLTNGVLYGEVIKRAAPDSEMILILKIFSPALGEYSLTVISASHGLGMYPVYLLNSLKNENYKCENLEEFEGSVKDILSSPHTKNVISTLISQSTE